MRPQGRIRGSSSFKLSQNTRLQMRVQKNITSTRCAQDIEGLSEGRKFTDSFSEPASHFTRESAGKINELGLTLARCYGGNLVCAPGGATRRGSRSNFHRRRACRCRSRKTSLRLGAGKISRGCPRVENSTISSASRQAISAGFTRQKRRAPRSSDSAATGKS